MNMKKDILEMFSDGFPLLQKVYEVYSNSKNLSVDDNNTLRRSTEMTALEIVELVIVASRQGGDAKKETLKHALYKVDAIKVFTDIARQTELITEESADDMSESLNHVDKMISNWLKALNTKK